ncbi:thiamine pyrophosphate-dependent enzyme, partial [Candidatus Riflebacteria bacterium]
MENVYQRPESMTGTPFSFRPIREHAHIFRLIGELVDELHIREKTIGVVGIGVSSFMPEFFNFDFISAAHGRAPSVASGIKTVNPDNTIFTYQGYRDLAERGISDLLHRATDNCNITSIYVNNSFNTTESEFSIFPLEETEYTKKFTPESHFPVAEILAATKVPCFVARGALYNDESTRTLKKYLKAAFEKQIK